jgi:hypothetical protein
MRVKGGWALNPRTTKRPDAHTVNPCAEWDLRKCLRFTRELHTYARCLSTDTNHHSHSISTTQFALMMGNQTNARFNPSEASLQTSVFHVNPIRSYQFEPTRNKKKTSRLPRKNARKNLLKSDGNAQKNPQDFTRIGAAFSPEGRHSAFANLPSAYEDQNTLSQINEGQLAARTIGDSTHPHLSDISRIVTPVMIHDYDMHHPIPLPVLTSVTNYPHYASDGFQDFQTSRSQTPFTRQ